MKSANFSLHKWASNSHTLCEIASNNDEYPQTMRPPSYLDLCGTQQRTYPATLHATWKLQ